MTTIRSSLDRTPPATENFRRDAPGMLCLDTTRNARIVTMMELVGGLSRATEPGEVIRIFAAARREMEGPRGFISLSTRGLEPGAYRVTRLVHDEDPGGMSRSDPWRDAAALPVHRGGFLGDLIRSAYPEVIYNLDLADDPVLGDALARYRSLMAIPLFDHGEPLNWAIMLDRRPEGFTEVELEEQILSSNLIGGTVRNVLIARELRDAHARIRAEVDRIAGIQRKLLPDEMPHITGLELAARLKTFDTAGGDIYDIVPLDARDDGGPDPDGRWAVLIADASGHGPAATTVVAMLNALIHAYPDPSDGPAKVLAFANRHLYAKRLDGTFVTAVLGVYDARRRTFAYARAGHPPALVKSPGSGSAVARLDGAGGLPLGVLDETTYDEAEVALEPGQTVLLYTDGIAEASSPDGEPFGVEGIERALVTCSGEPDCVAESISTALIEHEAGTRPADDQTLLTLKVR